MIPLNTRPSFRVPTRPVPILLASIMFLYPRGCLLNWQNNMQPPCQSAKKTKNSIFPVFFYILSILSGCHSGSFCHFGMSFWQSLPLWFSFPPTGGVFLFPTNGGRNPPKGGGGPKTIGEPLMNWPFSLVLVIFYKKNTRATSIIAPKNQVS